MAYLYGYFDESGKHHDHPIIVFNALVDKFDNWRRFGDVWASLLRQFELTEFHAKEALRHSQKYGKMQPGTAEDRAKDVMPFVRAIVEGIELGVVAAVDVSAYKSPTHQELRANVDKDPHFFAFYVAVSQILLYWAIPKNYTVGLILDDDEEKSISCYRFLKRLKRVNEDAKKRVTSICFSDDKDSPQVQAVDLFSYLCRTTAEAKFLNKHNVYPSLSEAFDIPTTGNEKIQIRGGYFQDKDLIEFAESQRRR